MHFGPVVVKHWSIHFGGFKVSGSVCMIGEVELDHFGGLEHLFGFKVECFMNSTYGGIDTDLLISQD